MTGNAYLTEKATHGEAQAWPDSRGCRSTLTACSSPIRRQNAHRTKWIFLVLSMLAASGLALGQGSSTEQSIKALMEQQRQAALKGDAATYSKLLSDDYIGINYFGAIVAKADILQNLKSGKMKYEAIDVSDEQVRVY